MPSKDKCISIIIPQVSQNLAIKNTKKLLLHLKKKKALYNSSDREITRNYQLNAQAYLPHITNFLIVLHSFSKAWKSICLKNAPQILLLSMGKLPLKEAASMPPEILHSLVELQNGVRPGGSRYNCFKPASDRPRKAVITIC